MSYLAGFNKIQNQTFSVNNNSLNQSPLTQDSSSMNSYSDDFDFRNIETSSSAQTSTVTSNQNHNSNMQNYHKEPKLSSLSFYNGPAMNKAAERVHASKFRKSLVISPSFNSITSNPASDTDFDESRFIGDSKIEEPTKNIGMVISPSIRALSDILTSKVNSKTSLVNDNNNTIIEEAEGDENDNETIQFKSNLRRNSSLIDDIFSTDVQSTKTFKTNNSNDTLQNHLPQDLIDLSSPVVDSFQIPSEPPRLPQQKSQIQNSQQRNLDPNYSDMFESYSPVKKGSIIEEEHRLHDRHDRERSHNRFSMMSDNFNFNQLQSPSLNFNSHVESIDNINPSITHSISKLSINDESFHAIGYDDGDGDNSEFSFLPSRTNTLNQSEKNLENRNSAAFKSPNTFTQRHNPRNSIRIVDDTDEEEEEEEDIGDKYRGKEDKMDHKDGKSSFSDNLSGSANLHFSTGVTPVVIPSPQFEDDLTPIIPGTTTFGGDNTSKVPVSTKFESPRKETPTLKDVPSLSGNHTNASPSKSLLNSSPIRNTSPTLEHIDKSPRQEVKKTYINLSPDTKFSKQTRAEHVQTQQLHKVQQQSKPKNKLTFKSLFSKTTSTEHLIVGKRKSPILESVEKFGRPKSMVSAKQETPPVAKGEKKEKSKSLLSGWKRKSFGFSKTNLHDDLEKKPTKTKEKSKTSQGPFTKSHKSTSSMPIISSPKSKQQQKQQERATAVSPHRHTKSEDLFEKKLPVLPPPETTKRDQDQHKSLLQTYGFNNTLSELKESPILHSSPSLHSFHDPVPLSPTWDRVPTVKRSTSENTIETSNSPPDLLEPQKADISSSSPALFNVSHPEMTNKNNGFNDPKDNSELGNTSSTYDESTENPTQSNHLEFFKPPQALGITTMEDSPVATTPRPLSGSSFSTFTSENNLLKTPQSFASPAISVVESFVASPNRYHIGDDMYPKSLGINEIESIVSLERSRSMRSIRSAANAQNPLNHKSSILSMIQGQDVDGFNEMRLPDGMVVIKSPMTDQHHAWSKPPSRTTSILKKNNSIKSNNPTSLKQVTTVDNDTSFEDDDFNDLINLINFDDDDDDIDMNTDFNINTDINLELSPLKSHCMNEQSNISNGGDLHDYLGIDTTYNSMRFDDDFNFEDSPIRQAKKVEYIPQRESIDLVSTEEGQNQLAPFGFDSPTKGLKGPSLNSTLSSSLKPETRSAILDSLNKNLPVNDFVHSESENSISYIAGGQHYGGYFRDSPNIKQDSLLEYQYKNQSKKPSDEESRKFDFKYNQSFAQHLPVTSSDVLSALSESPSPSRFALNNPFSDYTQSYDDDYSDSVNVNTTDKVNKRKSLNFMGKFSNPANLSTSSLPVMKDYEKPKKLVRKRNKTSVSFGSMFEALVPTREEEKPTLNVKFSSRILLYDTYGEDEYDRRPDAATCNSLTPQIAMEIRNELNQVKAEMPIHEESRCYTHFF